MIPLIGITGKARHGKDTVARMLQEELPGYKLFAFADALKAFGKAAFAARLPEEQCKEGKQVFMTSKAQLIHAAIGFLHPARDLYLSRLGFDKENIDVEFLIDELIEQHPDFEWIPGGQMTFTSSWRHLWQLIGTDWARRYISDSYWIEPFLPIDGYHIVSDVRCHGELEGAARYIEAQSIIERGGLVIKVVDPRKSDEVRSHCSEDEIDDAYIAVTIINDGTLDSLNLKVKDFVKTWIEKDGV